MYLETGTDHFSQDSLHNLNILEEYGIEIHDVLNVAFEVAHENHTASLEERRQSCWRFLPEEEMTYGEPSPANIPGTSFSKREKFIMNSERIEKCFGEALEEALLDYQTAFSGIMDKEANHVAVVSVRGDCTCIQYWK